MTANAPRLIVDPESSRKLRAKYAPRHGEPPKIVTLGHYPGLPMGRYYVHPDGSLTRPSDELRATIQNLRDGFERAGAAVRLTFGAFQQASAQFQSDLTKGA